MQRAGEPRIDSPRHPVVAAVRRLRRAGARRDAGLCLAEGPHLAAEALAAGLQPVSIFVTREYAASGPEASGLLGRLRAARAGGAAAPAGLPPGLVWASPRAFAALADTSRPQGLLAVLPVPRPPAVPAPWTLALDGVQDPGNVGALARALLAFAPGRGLLLTGPGTADPFGDKALRASAGALFHIDHRHAAGGLGPELGRLAAGGARVWALCPRGGAALARADLGPPLVLVVGGEGAGVSPQVLAVATPLTVPTASRTESLGAAAAGAIALYQAAQQA